MLLLLNSNDLQETNRHTPGLEGQQALEDHSGGGVGGGHDAGNDPNGLSHLLDAVLQGGAVQRGSSAVQRSIQAGALLAGYKPLMLQQGHLPCTAGTSVCVHLSPTHLWVVLNDVAGLEVLVLVVDVLAGKVVLDDLRQDVSTACRSAQHACRLGLHAWRQDRGSAVHLW